MSTSDRLRLPTPPPVAGLAIGYYYRVLVTATNSIGDSIPSASNDYQYNS